jgi:cytochrome P450
LPSHFQSQNELVWTGRIPENEKVTILDNGTEQKHVVVRSLISIVDKQEHARRKRPWSKGFSTSALKGYENLVIKRTLQFVEVLLSKNLKEAVNLPTWIEYLTFVAMVPLALY